MYLFYIYLNDNNIMLLAVAVVVFIVLETIWNCSSWYLKKLCFAYWQQATSMCVCKSPCNVKAAAGVSVTDVTFADSELSHNVVSRPRSGGDQWSESGSRKAWRVVTQPEPILCVRACENVRVCVCFWGEQTNWPLTANVIMLFFIWKKKEFALINT